MVIAMSRRWLTERRKHNEELAPGAARVLVLGYLIAAGLGVVAGMLWIAWNLLR